METLPSVAMEYVKSAVYALCPSSYDTTPDPFADVIAVTKNVPPSTSGSVERVEIFSETYTLTSVLEGRGVVPVSAGALGIGVPGATAVLGVKLYANPTRPTRKMLPMMMVKMRFIVYTYGYAASIPYGFTQRTGPIRSTVCI